MEAPCSFLAMTYTPLYGMDSSWASGNTVVRLFPWERTCSRCKSLGVR